MYDLTRGRGTLAYPWGWKCMAAAQVTNVETYDVEWKAFHYLQGLLNITCFIQDAVKKSMTVFYGLSSII